MARPPSRVLIRDANPGNAGHADLMKTYVQYQKFQWLRDQLEEEGVNIPLPSGN